MLCYVFFFQAEDGIRDLVRSRGLGDVYKRQILDRRATDVERKMYSLMRREALRRVGVCCRLTEWMGGAGTYGWMAGFEDASIRTVSKTDERVPIGPSP